MKKNGLKVCSFKFNLYRYTGGKAKGGRKRKAKKKAKKVANAAAAAVEVGDV